LSLQEINQARSFSRKRSTPLDCRETCSTTTTFKISFSVLNSFFLWHHQIGEFIPELVLLEVVVVEQVSRQSIGVDLLRLKDLAWLISCSDNHQEQLGNF